MRGIWLDENRLASQEGLWFLELTNKRQTNNFDYIIIIIIIIILIIIKIISHVTPYDCGVGGTQDLQATQRSSHRPFLLSYTNSRVSRICQILTSGSAL
jgi:hypothetical protein